MLKTGQLDESQWKLNLDEKKTCHGSMAFHRRLTSNTKWGNLNMSIYRDGDFEGEDLTGNRIIQERVVADGGSARVAIQNGMLRNT